MRDVLHAATMVGRLAGARRAVELGFAILPDPGPSGKLGHWRIAGIPLRAMEMLSKRSAEIDAAVAEAGHGTYQARQVAARTTRRAKRHTPEAELMPGWRRELEDAGLGVERLAEMVLEDARNLDRPQPLSSREVEQIAADALAAGGALAERKVFTRADVIVAVDARPLRPGPRTARTGGVTGAAPPGGGPTHGSGGSPGPGVRPGLCGGGGGGHRRGDGDGRRPHDGPGGRLPGGRAGDLGEGGDPGRSALDASGRPTPPSAWLPPGAGASWCWAWPARARRPCSTWYGRRSRPTATGWWARRRRGRRPAPSATRRTSSRGRWRRCCGG